PVDLPGHAELNGQLLELPDQDHAAQHGGDLLLVECHRITPGGLRGHCRSMTAGLVDGKPNVPRPRRAHDQVPMRRGSREGSQAYNRRHGIDRAWPLDRLGTALVRLCRVSARTSVELL